MPMKGVKSAKRQRQYEHVKESELEQGRGEERASEIAARTVNKQRRESGETKNARGSGGGGRKRTAKKSSGGSRGAAKGTRASGASQSAGGSRTRSAKKTAKKTAKKR